ncbi:GTP cyclohydrolase II [Caldithrix abyssi]|nr:GTP cyclohydrolase II [Caldithrix abyssi]
MKKIIKLNFPTSVGEFDLHAYEDSDHGVNHLALVKGSVDNVSRVLVRIHSECFTGDVLGSLRCDCGDQLRAAHQAIQNAGSGVLIYLRQEGRGIGLINKLHAYKLQDNGLDTVDANLQLGFKPDQRDYKAAISILLDLKVNSIRLLTNNPSKVAVFDATPIKVEERVPLQIDPNHNNIHYLTTKRDRLGHILDLNKNLKIK